MSTGWALPPSPLRGQEILEHGFHEGHPAVRKLDALALVVHLVVLGENQYRR